MPCHRKHQTQHRKVRQTRCGDTSTSLPGCGIHLAIGGITTGCGDLVGHSAIASNTRPTSSGMAATTQLSSFTVVATTDVRYPSTSAAFLISLCPCSGPCTNFLLSLVFILNMVVKLPGPCILASRASIPPILRRTRHICSPCPQVPLTELLLVGTNKCKQ